MRFKNYADYQRVVNVFEQLKFPINNAVNREAPMRPLRPASASLVQHPSRTYIRNQPSTSNVAKNYETRASSTVNEASDALPRPCLTEDSPFFRRSHTASSETVRPGSSWSLDGSRVSDTVSSMSSNETLVRANSVLDHVGPGSAISGSQFERVVCLLSAITTSSPLYHFLRCVAHLFNNGGVLELDLSS
jgi:hypothetical protein